MTSNFKEEDFHETIPRVISTAVYIYDKECVLLGYKKRGFGKGFWNGFGGKMEPGESIVECAAREIKEECGLMVEPQDLKQYGTLEFKFEYLEKIFEVHIFKCTKFSGDIIESDEMLPKWFPQNDLPICQMWGDNPYWYPLLLQQVSFHGYFYFKDNETLLSYKIDTTDVDFHRD